MNKEWRDKISKGMLGHKIPNNVKKKISKSRIGKKHSLEIREKIRMSMKKGIDHPKWNGGQTENEKIRNSYEMKLWKKAVYERDNFTCQKYGIKGGRLIAHHINNFAEFPELRFAIDNGITLSEKAHKEFHKKYGIKNNTKEQIKEFMNNN